MQDTFDLQKHFEDRKILLDFNSFFSLPDGIQESGFTWQNAKGDLIDCNVYHPKYGGIIIREDKNGIYRINVKNINKKKLLERGLRVPFASNSLQNFTGYNSAGYEILCKWNLQCVCIKDGRFYAKDGVEIFKKPVFLHKRKYASTDQDFELIFQRELKKANCKNTTAFKEMLRDKTLKMRNNEWLLDPDARAPFLDLQNIADKFIEWLRDRDNDNSKPTTKTKKENKHEIAAPNKFEDMFYSNDYAALSLEVLKKLEPAVINEDNVFLRHYSKGVFPLWIKVLKNFQNGEFGRPALIKIFTNNSNYSKLINSKIQGANLLPDASEFSKTYTKLEKNNVEKEIEAILKALLPIKKP